MSGGHTSALRVLLVGDDPLARGRLAALLAGEGVEVVGEISAEGAVRLAPAYRPQAVAWDFRAGRHHRLSGEVPVLALVDGKSAALEALGAGASGALARGAQPARIVAALGALAAGLYAVDGAFAKAALRPPGRAAEELPDALTLREREVLELVAAGLSNKGIGARLAISEHTAKAHVVAILGKLGAATRAEAVTRAAKLGLLAL